MDLRVLLDAPFPLFNIPFCSLISCSLVELCICDTFHPETEPVSLFLHELPIVFLDFSKFLGLLGLPHGLLALNVAFKLLLQQMLLTLGFLFLLQLGQLFLLEVNFCLEYAGIIAYEGCLLFLLKAFLAGCHLRVKDRPHVELVVLSENLLEGKIGN